MIIDDLFNEEYVEGCISFRRTKILLRSRELCSSFFCNYNQSINQSFIGLKLLFTDCNT